MSRACMLVLSENDYRQEKKADNKEKPPPSAPSSSSASSTNTGNDMAKLMALYTKCRSAASLVQAKAIDLASFSMSSGGGGISGSGSGPPGVRAQQTARPLMKKAMHPPRRGSLAHLARTGGATATTGGGRSAKAMAQTGRPALKREPSDSSLASMASVSSTSSGVRGPNKKQRLPGNIGVAHKSSANIGSTSSGGNTSNTTGGNADAAGGKKGKSPPPEALSFLQALNSQEGAPASTGRPLRGIAAKKPTPPKKILPKRSAARR